MNIFVGEYFFRGWIFSRGDYFSEVNIFRGEYYPWVNICQRWIFIWGECFSVGERFSVNEYFSGVNIFQAEYFTGVNIFGIKYFSGVNIVQEGIFFKREYFSEVNIFFEWIFLGVNFFSQGVNIFQGWISSENFQQWIILGGETWHFSIWVSHSGTLSSFHYDWYYMLFIPFCPLSSTFFKQSWKASLWTTNTQILVQKNQIN